MTGSKEIPRRGGPKPVQAILRAALRVLTDQDYAGMSVEKVASVAGVEKTTIYRRYASKEELAAAVVGAIRDDLGPPPDTGNAHADFVEMLVQTQVGLERGLGFAMMGALLVEERRNPEFFELFREPIMRPRRDDAVMILQRGVDRGQIRPGVALEIAVHAIVGSVLARHILALISQEKPSKRPSTPSGRAWQPATMKK